MEKDKDTVKVPLNDVVMEIVEGIWSFKGVDLISLNYSRTDGCLSVFTRNESEITYTGKYDLVKNIRASPIQLFIYLLAKYQESKDTSIEFKPSEFAKTRNITVRSETRQAIIEDLNFLQRLKLKIKHKEKKERLFNYSSELLSYEILGQKVIVQLGDWTSAVSPSKYVELSKGFFQLKGNKEAVFVPALLKLTQMKHLNKSTLRVKTLLEFLGFNKQQLDKRGYKNVKNLIKTALETINLLTSYQLVLLDEEKNTLEQFLYSLIQFPINST